MAELVGRNETVITFIASGTVTGNTFVGAADPTTGKRATCADGVMAGGVCRDTTSTGKVGDMITGGTAYVTSSANLADGVPVACGAAGSARVATTGDVVLGWALGNWNSGEMAEIRLGVAGIF